MGNHLEDDFYMRILILANNVSGLLSFRKEVLIALRKNGSEVYVSAPDSSRKSELQEIGCTFIATEIDRRGMNPLTDMLLFVRYCKMLRKVKPDVVLGYTIKPNIYGGMACRLLGIPSIVNITGLGTAVENPGILQKLTVLMYKVALKSTSCIFFQNEANKDFFKRLGIVPKVKKRLLPGSGVNLERFVPMEYPNAHTTEFIFISRIMRQKGIDEYLYVAEKMKEKCGERVVFHVLGGCEDDAYNAILKDMVAKGIICYHGQQSDVRPFIGRTHCTIHPSYYPEGMSNVLLESEAMGHPVITTKRPGCRETVEDGVTGFLFDEKDKEQLLVWVEKFVALPYEEKKQMGINARKRMERLFDRKIVVKAYLEEIQNITK